MRSIRGGGGLGCLVVSGSGKGVQNLMMGCNIEKSESNTFISVIVYPHTLQFVTISFFLTKGRAYCTFYIYLAKPLSKVHVSNNRSNTDYYPQDIPLHSRMVHKIG